jgi:hypothetical protein
LTEYPLDYAYFLLPLGLIVGALDAISAKRNAPTRHVLRMRRAPWLLATTAAGVMTVWVASEYAALEADHALMRLQWQQPELASMGQAAVPPVVLLTQLRALLLAMRTPTHAGLSGEQLQALDRAAQRYGYWPVLLKLALANNNNNRPAQAQAALLRLCLTQTPRVCTDITQQVERGMARQP